MCFFSVGSFSEDWSISACFVRSVRTPRLPASFSVYSGPLRVEMARVPSESYDFPLLSVCSERNSRFRRRTLFYVYNAVPCDFWSLCVWGLCICFQDSRCCKFLYGLVFRASIWLSGYWARDCSCGDRELFCPSSSFFFTFATNFGKIDQLTDPI